jgi:hypothetical protein
MQTDRQTDRHTQADRQTDRRTGRGTCLSEWRFLDSDLRTTYDGPSTEIFRGGTEFVRRVILDDEGTINKE